VIDIGSDLPILQKILLTPLKRALIHRRGRGGAEKILFKTQRSLCAPRPVGQPALAYGSGPGDGLRLEVVFSGESLLLIEYHFLISCVKKQRSEAALLNWSKGYVYGLEEES
jgi:hypothetical protein